MNTDSYGDALDMALNQINEQSKQIEALTAQVGVLKEAIGNWDRAEADELQAAEARLIKCLATTPESALGEVRRAEREKCAVAAWSHYMDQCKKSGISPTVFEGWCSASAIRAMGDE